MNSRHPGRPRKEEWAKCKADGCQRTSKGGGFGFCHSHYVSVRRGYLDKETGRWLREGGKRELRKPGIPCLVPQCGSKVRSGGMCNRHYLQLRAGILDPMSLLPVRELLPLRRPKRHEKWVQRDGYVLITAPAGHPHARQDGSILEHRLVMEQCLGRPLEEWEIVHHKDGNRGNNSWENLELLDGRARRGEGHSPAHEMDPRTAIQVLVQREDTPPHLREQLLLLVPQRAIKP